MTLADAADKGEDFGARYLGGGWMQRVRKETEDTILVPEHFGTITEAIEAAKPGATIRVGPGIYRENLVIRKAAKIMGAQA